MTVQPWEYLIAAAVGIMAAARLTRLIVQDTWPPAAWLRAKWDDRTQDSGWNELLHCGYCFAPWAMAPILATAVIFSTPLWWWLFNGWLAGSYIASMIVQHDEGIVIITRED